VSTWKNVEKGNVVELSGREWTVVKIKRDGKKAKVTVEHRGRTASSVVKLADKVRIVSTAAPAGKRGPLYDASGTAQRWATKKEAREVTETIGAGDPAQTEPPALATGSPWTSQADRIEERLDRLLQARLVGETKDEAAGYYVPPVDVSTVAGHMVIYHGGIPTACDDEGKMLRAHEAQHAAAAKGEGILAVNHWHTERRP